MVKFEIDKNSYKCFEKWAEMPLSKGIELAIVCNWAPGKLKEYYSIITSVGSVEEKEERISKWSEEIGDNELIKEFPAFYGKVIQCLCSVSDDVIGFVNEGFRFSFYKKYCEKFVIGILNNPIDYDVVGMKSFYFEDVEYHLPVTRDILGNKRPMADRSTIEFTESADLQIASKQLESGKFEYAANIIAILCRPVVHEVLEPYVEATCLSRADKFKSLTMDIVWEVFFCLSKHITLYNLNTVSSFLKEKAEALKLQNQAD